MNEDVLQQVLSEVLNELKDLKKDQEMTNVALVSYKGRIDEFQDAISVIKEIISKQSQSDLKIAISTMHTDLKNTIRNQPKEVLHEKRILLYPEGDGSNFFKALFERFVIYLIFLGFLVCLGWLGLENWRMNNENARFKYSYFWVYQKQNKDSKKYLFETFKEFENDSIFKLRKEKIKLTFDN